MEKATFVKQKIQRQHTRNRLNGYKIKVINVTLGSEKCLIDYNSHNQRHRTADDDNDDRRW